MRNKKLISLILIIICLSSCNKSSTIVNENSTSNSDANLIGNNISLSDSVSENNTSNPDINNKQSEDLPLVNRDDVVTDIKTGISYVPGRAFFWFNNDIATSSSSLNLINKIGASILWNDLSDLTFVVMFDNEFEDHNAFKTFLDGLVLEYAESEGLDFAAVDDVYLNSITLEANDPLGTYPNDPWGGTGDNWYTWDEEGNYTREGNYTEEDINFQWGMEAIRAPYAWNLNYYMQSVKVGVIDTGFFTSPNADYNINVINEDNSDMDSHGTHVAGIIGATADNGRGVTGVAWNADLYGYDCNGFGGDTEEDKLPSFAKLTIGTLGLAKSGVRVINASIGANWSKYEEKQTPEQILEQVAEDNINYTSLLKKLNNIGYNLLFVQSAGNSGNKDVEEQAKLAENNCLFSSITDANLKDQVIIVGSAEFSKQKLLMSDFSSYGKSVDIFAPGSRIYSAVYPGQEIEEDGIVIDSDATLYSGFARRDGTSMAAPHVTGVAAMLFAANPMLTAEEAKEIILSTSTKDVVVTGRKDTNGYLLNAEAALGEAIKMRESDSNFSTGTVTGSILDSITNKPISNVTLDFTYDTDSSLTLLSNGITLANEPHITTTDDKGSYAITLEPGIYRVNIKANGYEEYTSSVQDPKSNVSVKINDNYDADFKLSPTKVTNSEDNDKAFIDYLKTLAVSAVGAWDWPLPSTYAKNENYLLELGILSAEIDDFDNDGMDELLIISPVGGKDHLGDPTSFLCATMYENGNDGVQESDSVMLNDENSSLLGAWVDNNIDVFIKDDLICQEKTKEAYLTSTGHYWRFVAYRYADNKFTPAIQELNLNGSAIPNDSEEVINRNATMNSIGFTGGVERFSQENGCNLLLNINSYSSYKYNRNITSESWSDPNHLEINDYSSLAAYLGIVPRNGFVSDTTNTNINRTVPVIIDNMTPSSTDMYDKYLLSNQWQTLENFSTEMEITDRFYIDLDSDGVDELLITAKNQHGGEATALLAIVDNEVIGVLTAPHPGAMFSSILIMLDTRTNKPVLAMEGGTYRHGIGSIYLVIYDFDKGNISKRMHFIHQDILKDSFVYPQFESEIDPDLLYPYPADEDKVQCYTINDEYVTDVVYNQERSAYADYNN